MVLASKTWLSETAVRRPALNLQVYQVMCQLVWYHITSQLKQLRQPDFAVMLLGAARLSPSSLPDEAPNNSCKSVALLAA